SSNLLPSVPSICARRRRFEQRCQPRMVGTRAAVQMVGGPATSGSFAYRGQSSVTRLNRGAVAAAHRVGEARLLAAHLVVREAAAVERFGNGLAVGVVACGEVLLQHCVVDRPPRRHTADLDAMSLFYPHLGSEVLPLGQHELTRGEVERV